MELTKLERAVLNMTLTGQHPVLEALRVQLAGCSVIKREFSGVGFFTSIAVPPGVPRVTLPGRVPPFRDVHADFPSAAHGAGFVVFVEDGTLTMLEGFTYDEPWPETIDAFSLRYVDPSQPVLALQVGEPQDADSQAVPERQRPRR